METKDTTYFKVLFEQRALYTRDQAVQAFLEIRDALEKGEVRVAQQDGEGLWTVNTWVKEAILWGFGLGTLRAFDGTPAPYVDKDTWPLRTLEVEDGVRLVPGGSAIRSGAYVAPSTVIMPPAYINVGAYVDSGSMIDSHALVGSCAQVGRRVHLSAASQLGGVLEPVGALPVIIEDDVFIGGNCGIYEGCHIQSGAVIGTGVVLNASTAVFDATNGAWLRATPTKPLTIPARAVVVAGSRPLNRPAALAQGIHIYTPVIIKYRDANTNAAVALEDALRSF